MGENGAKGSNNLTGQGPKPRRNKGFEIYQINKKRIAKIRGSPRIILVFQG